MSHDFLTCLGLQIPRVDGEYDLKVPRDMAYVFSGAYVPLSCRIMELVSTSHPWPFVVTLGDPSWSLACPSQLGAGHPRPPSIRPTVPMTPELGPPQVLERRSWQGLDEVVRLLNCSECVFTGGWP